MEFEEIQKAFMSMNFELLDKLFLEQKFDDFEQILYRLAYDPDTGHENIFVYTYMLQLLGRGMDSRIHISITRLMGMILNHLNGGESIGLYHALKAYELEPDDADILEIILYYNHIPEKVLSDEEAIKFSKKLLKIRPSSLIARSHTGNKSN